MMRLSTRDTYVHDTPLSNYPTRITFTTKELEHDCECYFFLSHPHSITQTEIRKTHILPDFFNNRRLVRAMEPISFTVGTAIGLAGLYSVCLQAMEQITNAIEFEKDFGVGRTMFEIEKYLYVMWGKRVGIGRDSKVRHPCLDTQGSYYPAIRSILQSLEIIWSDTDTLCKMYGLDLNQKVSPRRRYVWAIRDKKRFENLVNLVGGFVEKLYKISSLEGDLSAMDGSQETSQDEVNKRLRALEVLLNEAGRGGEKEFEEQQGFRKMAARYIKGEEQKSVLAWIGAIQTEKEYDEVKNEISKDTCDWIFSNQRFLDWLFPPNGMHTSSILWIHGDPGMGKTFLSAKIIEYLKDQFSPPTAFFFCTHADDEKNQTLSIIRSWIYQLAMKHPQALEIVRSVKTSNDVAVMSTLWNMFTSILKAVGTCYLVLDGLDECLDYDPKSKNCLTGEMERFLKRSLRATFGTGARILIVSRDVISIRSVLGNFNHLSPPTGSELIEHRITIQDTENDIKRFSLALLKSRGFSDDEQVSICEQLSSRCEGMFLWVRLCSEGLRPGMRSTWLDSVIKKMPSGLDHAYKRNLLEIWKRPKHVLEHAIDTFELVLFSLRPLSVPELLHALAIKKHERERNSSTGNFQLKSIPTASDDVINEWILGPCGSLLQVRNKHSYTPPDEWHVHFIHFSAKGYLLNLHDSSDDSRLLQFSFPKSEDHHAVITKTCLSYQISAGIDHREHKLMNNRGKRLWTFEGYAFHSWDKHFHLSGENAHLKNSILRAIFLDEGPAFDNWGRSLERSSCRDENDKMLGRDGILPLSSQLLAACRFGMTGILKEMIEKRTQPMPKEALFVAACYNQQAIVRVLLQQKDIDINKVTCLRTPLYLASTEGHHGVVQELLMERDLRVNALDPIFKQTALMAAVRRGHESVVDCLLERDDVDVNYISLPSSILGEATALTIAITHGYTSIFRLLLERPDINVNLAVQDRTPLKLAVQKYKPTYVEMLLGRDDTLVNPIDKDGKTPLDYAGQVPEIARVIHQKGGKLCDEMEAASGPSVSGSARYNKYGKAIAALILVSFVYYYYVYVFPSSSRPSPSNLQYHMDYFF